MAEGIRVHVKMVERMLEEARGMPEVECCGLLAGRDGDITAIFPAMNAAASATTYEIAAEELFRMFKQMRAAGLLHLGIYHSHPRGPNVPSPADVKRAFYPDAAYFILSPLLHVAQPVRAFRIGNGRFREETIESL